MSLDRKVVQTSHEVLDFLRDLTLLETTSSGLRQKGFDLYRDFDEALVLAGGTQHPYHTSIFPQIKGEEDERP